MSAADALHYHLRNFPTTFSNLRADGINQWDPSISKRFALAEKKSVQIRMEAYNVLNHPVFAAPSTTASNTAFGLLRRWPTGSGRYSWGRGLVW